MTELEKRTWVYVQRPRQYEIPGHSCGNNDPDWSEFKNHLWCGNCGVDFIPEHRGVFEGPVPVYTSMALGLSFDRLNLETGQIEEFLLD